MVDFKKILRERGFPLSMVVLGYIVKYDPQYIRQLYTSDRDRFYYILDTGIKRLESISKPL